MHHYLPLAHRLMLVNDPHSLAQAFHDHYERLAPSFGYETRQDTRVFDSQSANGKLMIAVAAEIINQFCLAAEVEK